MTNEEHIRKLELRIKAYEQAINRIDDYFEYRHDSETDKTYVMDIIDGLAYRLKSLFHK